jgi:hypothetical protein
VRRLHSPTLAQWACAHQWKTTTSRPGKGDIVRLRYLTCRRCGLKVKSEERLVVPWDRGDFMTLVAQMFPEDAAVDIATLKLQGLLGENLSKLNAFLVPHGWQLELVMDRGGVMGVVRRWLRRWRQGLEEGSGRVDEASRDGGPEDPGQPDHMVRDDPDR